MAICDDCGSSFKSARGVKQHQRKHCPGRVDNDNGSNKNTDDSAPIQPNYYQLASKNDFMDFKDHINTVVNSLGETFFTEIHNLQTQVKFM